MFHVASTSAQNGRSFSQSPTSWRCWRSMVRRETYAVVASGVFAGRWGLILIIQYNKWPQILPQKVLEGNKCDKMLICWQNFHFASNAWRIPSCSSKDFVCFSQSFIVQQMCMISNWGNLCWFYINDFFNGSKFCPFYFL